MIVDLLYIGLGGALGSLARYQIGKMIAQRSSGSFPVNTLVINSLGAVLLGVVTGFDLNGQGYLLLAEGFLGAFTTFSTFMYEGFNLFKDNKKMNAVIYILGTLLLGCIGFLAGYVIAGWF